MALAPEGFKEGFLGDTWTHQFADPLTATVGVPGGAGTYTVGQGVTTSFSCMAGLHGNGIESCTDSGGSTSGAGRLDTSTLGAHTYTVTARSRDGEIGSTLIACTVVAAPVLPAPPTCTVPKLGGMKLRGAKKRIRAADCAVGKLKKRSGATARDGRVVSQSPRPGTEVPAGTKEKVTMKRPKPIP